jgi:hypothetical protein
VKPVPAGRTACLLLALLVGSAVRAEDAPARAAAPAATALNLDTTAIRGNQELPKVMYVVPWKDAAMAELAGRPVNSLVEEVLAPVDREVFLRQTRYFHQLHDAESLRPVN